MYLLDKLEFGERNMKKHLANMITGLRIIGSVVLLLFDAFSISFYITYLFCGFSDMIDGTVARKTNSVSVVGSKLDTVSDAVFIAVCTVKLSPMLDLPIWMLIWIAVIAIIKAANIALGFAHKGELVALHTALNKVTGILLFLVPLSLSFINPTYSLAVVCTVATVAAIQEGCYIARRK